MVADKLLTQRETKFNMREMYLKSLDLRHRVNSDGHFIFTMAGNKRPDKQGRMFFHQITFNSK